jgi:triosephosphate isomerase
MADSRSRGASRRRSLISGNWKMNLNHLEAIQVIQKLGLRLTAKEYETVDVSVHPPFTDLRSVQTLIDADELSLCLGAQNCHWEDKGAYTGEVSPAMLAKLNVRYVVVGHSERRQLFGENDEAVRRKLEAVRRHGMTPIVCVGETLEEHDAGETADRVGAQVRAALDGLGEQTGALVLAYEPIWAIGTGRNATPAEAQETCSAIRGLVGDLAGAPAAASIRIQYGGSVNPDNAAELVAQADIDGALVGGASLEPDTFAQVVQACAAVSTA